MRNILYVTGVTGLAYILSAIIQLYGSANIIARYGLIGLGQLAILKLYLYNSLPSIFDFGLSDKATYYTSNKLAHGKYLSIQNAILALVPFAIFGGVIATLTLFILLSIMEHYKLIETQFIATLKLQSIFFILFFLGNIAEGVVRGFKKHIFIRSSELITVTIIAIAPLLDYFENINDIFILIIILLIIKSIILILVAYSLIIANGINISVIKIIRFIKLSSYRIKKIFQIKILGLVDNKMPIFILSVFWDTTIVGLYDLMTKLPYLLKTFIGYINQLVLPYSSKNTHKADEFLAVPVKINLIIILTVPVYLTFNIFISDFIRIWFKVDISIYENYLKMLCILPFCTMNVGFLQQYFYGNRKFVEYSRKMQYLQIVISYTIFIVFLKISGPFSFIVGSVISWILIGYLYYKRFNEKLSIIYLIIVVSLLMISFLDFNLLISFNNNYESINLILSSLLTLTILEILISLIIYARKI